MDFSSHLDIHLGDFKKSVPLTNSFGKVYPALRDKALAAVLHLKPEEKVLDIGGGSNPFTRADVVTEPFLDHSSHRGGEGIRSNVEYVQCFAEDLPFREKEFDFSICRQVLEHVVSPEASCKEIMRVSKRGFIETPQKHFELLFGPNPSHNWFVTARENKIVFERRMFIRHPLRHLGLSYFPSTHEGQTLIHFEYKNLTNVQFYWENSFEFEVIDSEDGFNYSNPIHASEAHLDTAICGIIHGGHFLIHRESDAREAVRLRPEWALAQNTLGIILWKQGNYEEGMSCFKKAVELGDRDEYKFNANLQAGQEPQLADFDYGLPMDDKFLKQHASITGFDIPKYLYQPHIKQ